MDFWRQKDIFNPENINSPIYIIGAGGIGSPTIFGLSKMGADNITIYDHDIIEAHNLPNQFYRAQDIGKTKVAALKEICSEFAGNTVVDKHEEFKEQQLQGIIISGVDSMEARKMIWDKVKYNISIPFYIEARMGAQVARIYTIRSCDRDDIKFYERTLYSDEAALDIPCTERAIMYNTFMIASLICNQVKKIINYEEIYKEIICDMQTLTLFKR